MAAEQQQATKPVATPVVQIQNVSLEEFEKAVYAREHERASVLLLMALRRLKGGAEFIGYAVDPRVKAVLYTRFCAAVVAMLADPQYNISQDGFDHLAAEHAVLDLLFRASAFETSDHMLPQIAANPAEPDKAKLQLKDGGALVKFLLTYSLRSGFALNFEETFRRGPQTVFSLWAGMMSPLLTVAVQAQERRELLLGLHGLFADVKVPECTMATLSDAYMYTSYALRRDKHEAKATIHRLFARLLTERGLRPYEAPPTREIKERPTILVCVEWFTELHAMYRCYAPIIRQLRKRFRLVGMGRASDVDEVGKREFDEWHEVPQEHVAINPIAERIREEIRPDIVYYPSLGMALWWVALASVRLAPIQIMTLGHPASSRSPEMDYVLCDEGAIGDPALFSERIVTYPNGSARYLMRPDAEMPPPVVEASPEVVRIAVPAMLCKLNADYMRALREVAEKAKAAGRATEFHFFVNMIGVNLYQAAREIRDWLPTAKIYERTHYGAYLAHLSRCHLHLCTWPFGGTNSNIDSMLLGIPLVALWGDEPHERFDGMMIRRAQLPESCIAKSREEYVAEAVRLVVDDAWRNSLRDHLRRFDLLSEFYGESPHGDAFLRAVELVYLHHEELQADRAQIRESRLVTRDAYLPASELAFSDSEGGEPA